MRRTGTVVWFNEKKGFGFIRPDDGSSDVFVHSTAIERSGYRRLAEGERVEFEVVQGNRGMTAENVISLDFASEPAVLVLVELGDAPPEAIADVLSDLSILYRKFGGSGISFSLHELQVMAGEFV